MRGGTLAIIQPPGVADPQRRETVSETLHRLRPLLLAEEDDLEPPVRRTRPSAINPLPDGD